jgi:hypothetical protein
VSQEVPLNGLLIQRAEQHADVRSAKLGWRMDVFADDRV